MIATTTGQLSYTDDPNKSVINACDLEINEATFSPYDSSLRPPGECSWVTSSWVISCDCLFISFVSKFLMMPCILIVCCLLYDTIIPIIIPTHYTLITPPLLPFSSPGWSGIRMKRILAKELGMGVDKELILATRPQRELEVGVSV